MKPYKYAYDLKGWWQVPQLLANLRREVTPPDPDEPTPRILFGKGERYQETSPGGQRRYRLKVTVFIFCLDDDHEFEVRLRISGVSA